MNLVNLKGKDLVKLCKAINRASASIEFTEAFIEKLAKELTKNLAFLSIEEIIQVSELWVSGRGKTSKIVNQVLKQFLVTV